MGSCAYLRYLEQAESPRKDALEFVKKRLVLLYAKVGRVRLILKPKNARITLWVDNKPHALAATTELVLAPGKHTIAVKKGSKVLRKTLAVRAGTSQVLELDFSQ
jgi:hypothetical protein